jgi:hypothetical protein
LVPFLRLSYYLLEQDSRGIVLDTMRMMAMHSMVGECLFLSFKGLLWCGSLEGSFMRAFQIPGGMQELLFSETH